MTAYELDPDVLGTLAFVLAGSRLLHLRDPVGALEQIRTVARGEADRFLPTGATAT